MHRRDVLRLGAAGLGTTLAPALGAGTAAAHPGPYEPYGRLELEGAKEAVVSDDGETVYVAVTDGYATVDVSAPDRPRVLAERRDPLADREDGPLRGIQDVKVDGDRLLVAGPANSLRNALGGVLLVDVSDPAEPVEVAFHRTDYPVHNCFLRDGSAYLTGNDGEGNPLVILDAGDDGLDEVGRWSLTDHDPAWEGVPAGLRSLHDVWVQGGTAYLAMWDAGTWLVDVSDPAEPTYVADIDSRSPAELSSLEGGERRREATGRPGNHHYVTVDGDATLMAVGRETWATETEDGRVVGGPSGIDLWDLSDPTAPVNRATIDPPPTPEPTFGGTWTTAHNVDLQDGRLYSAWYQGGVKRHDVSDPANPREVSWWRDPERARFWTAQLAIPGPSTGFFVASSMGLRDVPAALYTFPDHAGTQADPPALGTETPRADVITPTPTATRTPTGTGGTGPTETPTAGTPTRGAETSEPGGTGDGTSTDDPTGVGAPGFGVGTAAAALGLSAWAWLARRRNRG